jgi:hypothetical protein
VGTDGGPDGVGVGEEQPALDPQQRDPRLRLVLGVALDVAVLAGCPRAWPRTATWGREARYSSSSDTTIPMNRPARVSKTSTPARAATAAMKSGRAAMP